MEEMKEVFSKLNDENQVVLNLVAKGMEIAQGKKEEKEK